MLGTSLDLPTLTIVVTGAVVAGFITGLAGFGTALVASGLWLHALPATMVPPLVALSSVAAQIVGLITVRKAFAAASFAFSSAITAAETPAADVGAGVGQREDADAGINPHMTPALAAPGCIQNNLTSG